jgi:hypothetical protein
VVPIKLEKFVKDFITTNPSENKQDIRRSLRAAVKAKQSGSHCMQCGDVIWAIGSAVCGWNGCFTCITGEADSSVDYEIDTVCW